MDSGRTRSRPGCPSVGARNSSSRPVEWTRSWTASAWSPIRQVATAVSGSGPLAHVAAANAVGSQSTASPARRPAVLRVMATPEARMTGRRPKSDQRIWPTPELWRSKPVTGSPATRAVAAQMNPRDGARTSRAVNCRQAPSRICPRIVSTTDDQRGVPGAMAWVNQRRAGSGRPQTESAPNRSFVAGPSSRPAQSLRRARAARGTGATSPLTRYPFSNHRCRGGQKRSSVAPGLSGSDTKQIARVPIDGRETRTGEKADAAPARSDGAGSSHVHSRPSLRRQRGGALAPTPAAGGLGRLLRRASACRASASCRRQPPSRAMPQLPS